MGSIVPNALAQSATSATPAADVWSNGAPSLDGWWFHGELEAGGRAFLNNPQKDGQAHNGGQSLAKFYEYSSPLPGPFLNGHLSTGSNNGLYQIDLWAKNVGYDDEKINLEASKAGEQYFNIGWDQTPHLYSNSAQTIYNGVGTNALTLPAGLSNTLYNLSGHTAIAGNQSAIASTINANSHQIDIGIHRDTADVEYRWTPTDAWDVRFNYSEMHRYGTQVAGVTMSGSSTSGVVSQVPAPVDDTTQNYGVSGEYAGSSPWGNKLTFKLGYNGSQYSDAYSSYTVANPFCPTGAVGDTCGAANGSPIQQMSMAPSNDANGFNATLGLDLPSKSRYMGTVSYSMMRQNAQYQPFTINQNSGVTYNGQNVASLGALPYSSLNGAINTLMSNNVVTTQITPELKTKFSYRYYDYDNETPQQLYTQWYANDSVNNPSGAANGYAPVSSLSVMYTKQDAGTELNWTPTREWIIGVAYGYERYDWTRADVNVTSENSGKAYIDWKPATWITTRVSWLNAQRTYNNYDYLDMVGAIQWQTPGTTLSTLSSTAMRQFYLDDRSRNKGQFSVSVDVIRGLTITPTVGYLNDGYSFDATDVGVTRDQNISAGVEVNYVVSPDMSLLFSYMNEEHQEHIRFTTATGTSPLTSTSVYEADVTDRANTFMAAINYAPIANKLDLRLDYTTTLGKDSQPQQLASNPAIGSTSATFVQYPDTRSTWQQVNVTAKYTFDPDTVATIGLPKGQLYAKLRYTWERDSVDNWEQDAMAAYLGNTTFGTANMSYMTWLAYDNPNYNVQLVSASIGFKW